AAGAAPAPADLGRRDQPPRARARRPPRRRLVPDPARAARDLRAPRRDPRAALGGGAAGRGLRGHDGDPNPVRGGAVAAELQGRPPRLPARDGGAGRRLRRGGREGLRPPIDLGTLRARGRGLGAVRDRGRGPARPRLAVDWVWQPTPEVVERSHLAAFLRAHGLGSYRELVARSIKEPEWYWPAVIDDMGLELFTPFTELVDLSRGKEWATWFAGATLNVAWNSCHRWARRPDHAERAAVVCLDEDGGRHEVTYAELSRRVTRLAEGLVALGLRPGDRVGLFLPMCVEAVVASHACAHAGLVQVPIFSGYGAPSVAERLVHGGLRAVVTADGSLRRGRVLRMKETLDEALAQAPSVEHVIVHPRLALGDVPMRAGRDVAWADVVAGTPGTLEPLRLDAEHPYILAYTSGTTGRPKGVVHAHGGFSVPICAHNYYLSDIHPEDVMLFVTDMGWIMGPWTVMGGGFCGCTIVFMEGAPDWPPDRLWRTIEVERVSVLGISPTVVRALVPHGDSAADLSSLRVFMTTGEPWNREPYLWLFEKVGGGRCPIVNASGGTEAG
ncbi:MAG: AMP-binding protein, partial [Actinobacteria bacterium]|nr:AMP-binding protein [Actinomycetota bacterium]